MTDPIADMLTRIRNASMVGKAEAVLPYSRLKHAIASVLANEGYIAVAEKVADDKDKLRIKLKYEGKTSVIRNLKRISRPGRRSYVGYQGLPRALSDRGIAVISTPQGVMSNKEARNRKLGGEVICEIY